MAKQKTAPAKTSAKTSEQASIVLSPNTLKILQNFASINAQIVTDAGKTLQTTSASKTTYAVAKIAETLPVPFAIYDLNEFLSILNLFGKDAQLFFGRESVTIQSTTGDNRVVYHYADPETVYRPKKLPSFKNPQVSFTLPAQMLEDVMKGANVLGIKTISLLSDGTNPVVLQAMDLSVPLSNTFSAKVGPPCETPYRFDFNLETLKILPDAYDIQIFVNGEGSDTTCFCQLTAKTLPVSYQLALESSSCYGELTTCTDDDDDDDGEAPFKEDEE